ncbi:putative chromatin-remodeling complex ATPase chain [Acorus calamus]|uniref:Chromatin-remodeling complex ATPase chain n=1 Tax=Acorus calamus TaxID=4465 RepID=A0AAV9EUX3_ACOCL|nr:putative chromatin-remodeling complex ATPase chain [Acorus calamus]
MAKIANSEASSDEANSISSTEAEDERMDDCGGGDDNLDEEDEEELEAVARTAAPGDDGDDAGEDQSTEDDEVRGSGGGTDEEEGADDDAPGNAEIGKRERARLREMQRLKKQKIQEILDAQNASIDADMNNKGKGRLNYLLQQTEIFAHFAKGDQSAREKRPGASHEVVSVLANHSHWFWRYLYAAESIKDCRLGCHKVGFGLNQSGPGLDMMESPWIFVLPGSIDSWTTSPQVQFPDLGWTR